MAGSLKGVASLEDGRVSAHGFRYPFSAKEGLEHGESTWIGFVPGDGGGLGGLGGMQRQAGRQRERDQNPPAAAKPDLPPGGEEASSAAAPTITGVPGSPSATTTIDGKQLPPPDPKFGGVIKDNAAQSKAWWAPRIVPPKGAPNVLLIMTDDVGFGAPSTFGGVIPTPALDRIANSGLRYTQFHSTALCSPTRAALITGRNHHSAGFGVVSEQSTGFPGYNSIIAKDKATIGRILKDNGFATSWFGKDHNTPTFQASQVGPFDQWPIGMGFEYFYGFVGGDTSQWQPNLFRNTTAIYPYVGHSGWNLTTAEADDAIAVVEPTQPDRPRASPSSATTCRRHARAASRHARVDQEDQRHAPVRQGLERVARAPSSPTRRSSASSRRTRR